MYPRLRRCLGELVNPGLAYPSLALLSLDPRKRRTTGMNEGNGRVLRRRSSESRRPRPCVGVPRGRSEALVSGCAQAGYAASKWALSGCRRAVDQRKATSVAAFSRAVSGPRGVGEPVHVRDLFMLRTGRAHDHPLVVMVGRVVRGRPRP